MRVPKSRLCRFFAAIIPKYLPIPHRPPSFFEPIPCAILTISEGAPVRQQKQEVGAGDARCCVQVVGNITMAENNRPAQSRDPFDRFDEAISDPRLYEADQSRYEQLRAQLRYRRSMTSRSPSTSSLSTSSLNTNSRGTSSPLRCRLSGRMCCRRNCRRTSRCRFSSPTTRKSRISSFPNMLSRAATDGSAAAG